MMLSENFSLGEASKSSTAIRLGIDNTPSTSLRPKLVHVATTILQPARDHFGVPIMASSWFRCEALEKAINWGGRDDSAFGRWCGRRGHPIDETSWSIYLAKKQHPTGAAVDFEVQGVANMDLARWAETALDYDQLILEFYRADDPAAGWVHLSSRLSGGNRRQVLTIGRGGIRSGLG